MSFVAFHANPTGPTADPALVDRAGLAMIQTH
jgi:hypothetical protein